MRLTLADRGVRPIIRTAHIPLSTYYRCPDVFWCLASLKNMQLPTNAYRMLGPQGCEKGWDKCLVEWFNFFQIKIANPLTWHISRTSSQIDFFQQQKFVTWQWSKFHAFLKRKKKFIDFWMTIILILEAPKSKTTSGNMFTGIDILHEN